MKCNVHVFGKMILSNKFGFILEAVFSYNKISASDHSCDKVPLNK